LLCNPDDFFTEKEENVHNGLCVVKRSKRKEWQNRMDVLKQHLISCIREKPSKDFQIIHLFYDFS